MAGPFDLLGLGCVAIDDSVLLDDFPPEDSKRMVLAQRRSLGGTTATALAAAARYGARCAFAGRLDLHAAAFAVDEFRRAGVDTTLVQHEPSVLPIHCRVIVSRQSASRTILFDLTAAAGASQDWPPEGAIRSARLLLIDHFGMEGMLRTAQIARTANVPIVADFEAHQRPEFAELLMLVDHLFVSQALAAEITGHSDPAAACGALRSPQRQVVVVTCGSAGCWHQSAENPAAVHLPAYAVATIDTTGCGDVFRGVYAAALAAGLPLDERLLQASSAAAIVAARPFADAVGRLPTRAEIEAFVAQSEHRR